MAALPARGLSLGGKSTNGQWVPSVNTKLGVLPKRLGTLSVQQREPRTLEEEALADVRPVSQGSSECNQSELWVQGAYGKTGLETIKAICREEGIDAVGAVSRRADGGSSYRLPCGLGDIPLSNSLEEVIGDAQVVVDFTNADGAMDAMRIAAGRGVNLVTGSTGFTQANLLEAERLANEHQTSIIVAPNFAFGAVLLTHLAKMASRFFDYADLTEVHHEAKADSPSGTALSIARAAARGKGGRFAASSNCAGESELIVRGGDIDGISVHSGRLPGRVAHHQLVFGISGQTLTLRHDSISRESFMPRSHDGHTRVDRVPRPYCRS